MASKAQPIDPLPEIGQLRLDLLLRPMPPATFALCALVVLIAGAAYCSGYEQLLSNRDNWPESLVWAAYALLPWLALFEYVKRREWNADAALPHHSIVLLVLGTWAASFATEYAHHALLLARNDVDIALPILRRLPGAGVFLLLIALSRREQDRARRRIGAAVPADGEVEALRRQAPTIRWIQAADNYLELHADGHVVTRRITMRAAEELLQPLGFVRVHRSVMVNRRHVDRIVPRSGGPAVQMIDGTALPTGRAFNANLRMLH
jgi:hypothetical protein